MASIKTHFFAGHDDGSVSADFRDERYIGKAEGDEHRTVPQLEVDPASSEAVQIALAAAPVANAKFQAAMKDALGDNYKTVAGVVHKALGGDGTATVFGLREGIWDN